MKKSIKKLTYTTAGLSILALTKISNAMDVGGSASVNPELVGSGNDVVSVLQSWLAWLVGFLHLIAVVILIWGGFNILTAGGDEEKVKKGKTILMQAVAGLIVIFLANSLISWVVDFLFNQSGG